MVQVANVPARLEPETVRRRLERMPAWSGDANELRRTLGRPAEGLWQHLQTVLDLSPHGGEIRRDGGELVVALRTESAGGVTAYDIALAQRIDDVLIDARPE